MKPIEIQNLDQHLKPLQVDGVSTGIEISTEGLRFTGGTLEVENLVSKKTDHEGDLTIQGDLYLQDTDGSTIYLVNGQKIDSKSTDDYITMTTTAFIKELGGFGKFLLLAAVLTFSISTMMSYSYYGSKCSGYLFGTKSIFYYRCFYIVTIVVGAMITIEVVINVVDGMYAVMAIPTVVGSVLLSGKVMEEAKRYFSTLD